MEFPLKCEESEPEEVVITDPETGEPVEEDDDEDEDEDEDSENK